MNGAEEVVTRHLDGHIVTVRIPMRFERIGGRKAVVVPNNVSTPPAETSQQDAPLVRALGRAYRWQRLLESGTYGSAEELAKAEKINPSYLSRILRLTLLAPKVVEAILQGRQPAKIKLQALLNGFSADWREQSSHNDSQIN